LGATRTLRVRDRAKVTGLNGAFHVVANSGGFETDFGVDSAEARKGFRKLRGYKGMPKLVAALRAHDAALGITLDAEERAA
jgi:hypothetical protein